MEWMREQQREEDYRKKCEEAEEDLEKHMSPLKKNTQKEEEGLQQFYLLPNYLKI